MPAEVWRYYIPWNDNYRQLWMTILVLGADYWSSVRAANDLNGWIIFLHQMKTVSGVNTMAFNHGFSILDLCYLVHSHGQTFLASHEKWGEKASLLPLLAYTFCICILTTPPQLFQVWEAISTWIINKHQGQSSIYSLPTK